MTDTEVCLERHKRLDERLDTQDRRLNDHSKRIDGLEQYQSKTETRIENLCEQIQNLVTTLRWAAGILLGALVSFFFYAVQTGVIG